MANKCKRLMLRASVRRKNCVFCLTRRDNASVLQCPYSVQPSPTLVSMPSPDERSIALLLSGGLDSAILLSHLIEAGRRVHPIYIRTGTAWQVEEVTAIHRYLNALSFTATAKTGHAGVAAGGICTATIGASPVAARPMNCPRTRQCIYRVAIHCSW